MLTAEQVAAVKVGDSLKDLTTGEVITVCKCLAFVRTRIAYVQSNPHEFEVLNAS